MRNMKKSTAAIIALASVVVALLVVCIVLITNQNNNVTNENNHNVNVNEKVTEYHDGDQYIDNNVENNENNINNVTNVTNVENNDYNNVVADDSRFENYYKIYTADDLFLFARRVNSGETSINAVLMADIDLENRDWLPIGHNGCNMAIDYDIMAMYNGIFDGNGHTISGLYCNLPDEKQVGLFGLIGSSAIIRNVILSDSYVCGEEAGGIVGWNDYGTIENCVNNATVEQDNHGGSGCGGIVGNNEEGYIYNCLNNGSIKNNS